MLHLLEPKHTERARIEPLLWQLLVISMVTIEQRSCELTRAKDGRNPNTLLRRLGRNDLAIHVWSEVVSVDVGDADGGKRSCIQQWQIGVRRLQVSHRLGPQTGSLLKTYVSDLLEAVDRERLTSLTLQFRL
jgi:hypothetical protein